MTLCRQMAFEAVVISALLLANLAVPAESLETLGFHRIGEIFPACDGIRYEQKSNEGGSSDLRCSDFSTRHDERLVGRDL